MVMKVLGWGLVALSVVIAFVQFPYAMLLLLLLGLAGGFISPQTEATARIAIYVLAAALPTIADQLDLVPMVGSYLNSIFDNLAVGFAGMALANLVMALVNNLMAPAAES
jgi:hypothetical protein